MVRIPMRNYHEGHYTVWSRDFGYPHLYPALKKMYSSHTHILEPAAVLECQSKRKQRGELLRADYKSNPLQAARRKGASQTEADKLLKEITDLETSWFPPPHLSKWKSPIPICFFEIAKCACPVVEACKCISCDQSCAKWTKCKSKKLDLRKQFDTDLLPRVHLGLIQNGPDSAPFEADKPPETMEKLNWKTIRSQDARACLSLCRPISNFVSKRKLHQRGAAQDVAVHQSGEITLRSPTQIQDEARGMLGGFHCTPEYLKEKFLLREVESEALPALISWLQKNNPWMAAYCHSASETKTVQEFVKDLHHHGRLLAPLPPDLVSDQPEGVLGQEPVALFQPVDDLNYSMGSYNHLRAAASKICRMKLTKPLPAEWNSLHESEFIGADGEPASKMPISLWWNKSFTGMSVIWEILNRNIFLLISKSSAPLEAASLLYLQPALLWSLRPYLSHSHNTKYSTSISYLITSV